VRAGAAGSMASWIRVVDKGRRNRAAGRKKKKLLRNFLTS
jgi:hypothetical protein